MSPTPPVGNVTHERADRERLRALCRLRQGSPVAGSSGGVRRALSAFCESELIPIKDHINLDRSTIAFNGQHGVLIVTLDKSSQDQHVKRGSGLGEAFAVVNSSKRRACHSSRVKRKSFKVSTFIIYISCRCNLGSTATARLTPVVILPVRNLTVLTK
jgi:hypothetical protein